MNITVVVTTYNRPMDFLECGRQEYQKCLGGGVGCQVKKICLVFWGKLAVTSRRSMVIRGFPKEVVDSILAEKRNGYRAWPETAFCR